MFDGSSLGLYWPWAIREMFDGSSLGLYWPLAIREMFDGSCLGVYWAWVIREMFDAPDWVYIGHGLYGTMFDDSRLGEHTDGRTAGRRPGLHVLQCQCRPHRGGTG